MATPILNSANSDEWLLFEEKINTLVPLNEDEYGLLRELFSFKTFKKHDFFIKNGDFAKQIAFVSKGVLRAFYQNENGDEYNKTFFKTGNFLGAYSSLISGKKNLIDIQCLTDCELLVANYVEFVALFEKKQKIERIARILSEQFFLRKEKREIELVTLNAEQRYVIFKQEHPNLDQIIPQYYIASYLGISATQLSRIRGKK